ncbi:MAG: peptide deformylase [Porticoccaceae bacterium]|jgi:peptide deformylase
MAIRQILRMGDPRLLQVSAPVAEFNNAALDALVADMLDTMAASNGAGLAAPQIGELKRVVIFGVDKNPRYPHAEPVPQTLLINPVITALSDEREPGWEGCLSVPGMRGLVSRYNHIRYKGFDAAGRPIEVEARGFHARVVQHECDHLDGILYPQKLDDPKHFGFIDELSAAGYLG